MRPSLQRTHFVVALVMTQLLIVPATQLLHVGCDHLTHTERHTSSVWSAVYDQVRKVWQGSCCECRHPSTGCSEPASTLTAEIADSPKPIPGHPKQQHDSDNCHICRAVFADRLPVAIVGSFWLPDSTAQDRPLVVEYVSLQTEYRLLSRGPPVLS